ncbi:F0F1 ATP synthase subunit B [Cytophagaceae bacterium ABcell3]|nr:F0F1 ATP synthase subunit B [Cytophagaceae bacterium ABcell3]
MELITPDFGLLFWQTLTFIIVLFILSKFAWKPIMQALKDRENTIEEALSSAQRAKEEMLQMKATNEKLLQEARLEREKILREAQATANEMVSKAKETAQVEGNRMIENARVAINTEKQAALTEVKNQAAELAIDIAEKLLRKELSDAAAQKELADKFIKDVNLN